ncbi:MAG: ArsR family transcriptional regulator [Thermoplasmata archaeon]
MTEKIGIPSEDTRTAILRYLLSKDMTAVELSGELDINESAVRRHLDILENKGLIDHDFQKVSRGRPKKYYCITQAGERLFPSKSDFLLESVLDAIVDEYGEEALEKIEERLVDNISGMLPEVEDKFHKRVVALTETFDDLGFYASHEKKNGEYYLRYENCAFSGLPERYSAWLCDVHREVIKRILGDIEFTQISSVAKGDRICLQKVGEKK